VLYQLRLQVQQYDNGQIYTTHKEQLYPIDNYRLRISQPRLVGPNTHFEENLTRLLTVGPLSLNQFLFDVRFESGYLLQVPGMKTLRFHLFCYNTSYFRE